MSHNLDRQQSGAATTGGSDDTDARVVRSREAILAAAEELLTTGGIEAVTHQSVALLAQVGRATVYRHWPRLQDLLLDTFTKTTAPVFDFGDGPLRTEIVGQLLRRLAWFNQPAAGAVIGAVIGRADFQQDMAAFRAVLFRDSVQTLVAQVERSRQRGELRVDVSPKTIAAVVMGAVFFDRYMLGETLTEQHVRSIVDTALTGWLSVPSPD